MNIQVIHIGQDYGIVAVYSDGEVTEYEIPRSLAVALSKGKLISGVNKTLEV